MVSLPTILPKQLLVEVADNQDGDDYDAPMNPPLMDYSMGQQNKGKLFMISWSFIPIFRHSRQERGGGKERTRLWSRLLPILQLPFLFALQALWRIVWLVTEASRTIYVNLCIE